MMSGGHEGRRRIRRRRGGNSKVVKVWFGTEGPEPDRGGVEWVWNGERGSDTPPPLGACTKGGGVPTLLGERETHGKEGRGLGHTFWWEYAAGICRTGRRRRDLRWRGECGQRDYDIPPGN